MATLLLIPWIIYGYKHPYARFLGLCQTRKNLLILFCIEVIYWLVLVLLVGNQDAQSVGEGSFAWRYVLLYEKGIIPIWITADKISPGLADRIDADFKILYLLAALIMDYVFLFFISPRPPQLFKKRKLQVSKHKD
jgi:hypothetical protein